MNAIQFGQTAKEHFESIAPGNISHGWEKYVATDGANCLIVRSDYKPKPGEMVFLCSIRNGVAMVELYRQGKPDGGYLRAALEALELADKPETAAA